MQKNFEAGSFIELIRSGVDAWLVAEKAETKLRSGWGARAMGKERRSDRGCPLCRIVQLVLARTWLISPSFGTKKVISAFSFSASKLSKELYGWLSSSPSIAKERSAFFG